MHMHPHAQATFELHRSNLLESDLLYLSDALGAKNLPPNHGAPKGLPRAGTLLQWAWAESSPGHLGRVYISTLARN